VTGRDRAAGDLRLSDTLAPAEAEADRHFGDGPVAAWRPSGRGAWHVPPRRVVLVLAAAALVATGAAAVARWMPAGQALTAEHTPPPDDDSEPSPEPLPAPPPLEPIDDAGEAAAPRPDSAATVTATLNITRHGRTWHIAANGVSRLLAAQTFAQLSGSPLRGSVDALAESPPLDLHWQGRDPAHAWQALLGSEVSYALQCDARRCQAWIVGDGTARPIATRHAAPVAAAARPAHTSAAAIAVPAPMQLTAEPRAAAPQADSPDPHIASHHD
jgi:hypothetical protein